MKQVHRLFVEHADELKLVVLALSVLSLGYKWLRPLVAWFVPLLQLRLGTKTFGHYLKCVRGDAERRAVADEAGVSRKKLLEWEQSVSIPSIDDVDKLVSAYRLAPIIGPAALRYAYALAVRREAARDQSSIWPELSVPQMPYSLKSRGGNASDRRVDRRKATREPSDRQPGAGSRRRGKRRGRKNR